MKQIWIKSEYSVAWTAAPPLMYGFTSFLVQLDLVEYLFHLLSEEDRSTSDLI